MSTGAALSLLSELNRLESLRKVDCGDSRRRFRRFRARGDAELYPAEGASVDRAPIDVKLRDLGRAGVGFVCEQPLTVGSVWRCCFLIRGHYLAQQTLIIRHCCEVQPGLYLVGGQFCLNQGLMLALGIDSHELAQCDHRDSAPQPDDFQSPGDLDADADDGCY